MSRELLVNSFECVYARDVLFGCRDYVTLN